MSLPKLTKSFLVRRPVPLTESHCVVSVNGNPAAHTLLPPVYFSHLQPLQHPASMPLQDPWQGRKTGGLPSTDAWVYLIFNGDPTVHLTLSGNTDNVSYVINNCCSALWQ
ncbi:hypothetical protein BaRGS_00010767 [Batillaria attramentaria]|uniref:Uncharacterized protein n=1 Tax=Batillaria attramentaria TaxID=370345 RepID=A0ABD0LFC5_9CAEN